MGTEGKDPLDLFVKHINDLKKARALLDRVFTEIGPDKTGEVRNETWRAVRDYFKFDDSE